MDLTPATTKELVAEIARREGVTEVVCPDPDHEFKVRVQDADGRPKEHGVSGMCNKGPARILVVID
jgi:hypothetical protein